MGRLHRILWGLVLLGGLESGASAHTAGPEVAGCYTSVWGHYHCPDGFYWSGGRDWGWRHHSWHHHHGWHDYGFWRAGWDWSYYRPSLYHDYYRHVAVAARVTSASVAPGRVAREIATDAACDRAEAGLLVAEERLRTDPANGELGFAARAAREEMLNRCVPPWMRRAAGLDKGEAAVPLAGSAL